MQALLDHRAKMVPHREAEARDAQEYWAQRKQRLGLRPEHSPEQALARIAAGRDYALTHAPHKMTAIERQAQVEQSQQHIRNLDTHLGKLGDEQYREQEHTTNGTQRTPASVAQVEQLLAVTPADLQPTNHVEHGREMLQQAMADRAAAVRERVQGRTRGPARVLDMLLEERPGPAGAVRVRLRERGKDQGIDIDF
jgi:hypothetical protein